MFLIVEVFFYVLFCSCCLGVNVNYGFGLKCLKYEDIDFYFGRKWLEKKYFLKVIEGREFYEKGWVFR